MHNDENLKKDQRTANSFANSWNNLPQGSVYTEEQVVDWMDPVKKDNILDKKILELGCGNASIMTYISSWNPEKVVGVDLGDSVESAKNNMCISGKKNWEIVKADMLDYDKGGYDLVYCIGVLHHLKSPKKGLDSVVKNTSPGGRFHCWVYGREGNGVVIYFVDPLRRIVSNFPWWFTKYFVATPLVVPYYVYAKALSLFSRVKILSRLPLYKYSIWISKRNFLFFRHVAFDQLVTPQTTYIEKKEIEKWLNSYTQIDQNTKYVIARNGNSWKFGAKLLK